MDLTEKDVEVALKDVFDPELGQNVIDLGLVYGITVDGAKGQVVIVMTMTTPGCPAERYITEGVRHRLLALEGVRQVDVDVVWSPPWTPDLMSDEIRAFFGF